METLSENEIEKIKNKICSLKKERDKYMSIYNECNDEITKLNESLEHDEKQKLLEESKKLLNSYILIESKNRYKTRYLVGKVISTKETIVKDNVTITVKSYRYNFEKMNPYVFYSDYQTILIPSSNGSFTDKTIKVEEQHENYNTTTTYHFNLTREEACSKIEELYDLIADYIKSLHCEKCMKNF